MFIESEQFVQEFIKLIFGFDFQTEKVSQFFMSRASARHSIFGRFILFFFQQKFSDSGQPISTKF